jgi:hypothetical protein
VLIIFIHFLQGLLESAAKEDWIVITFMQQENLLLTIIKFSENKTTCQISRRLVHVITINVSVVFMARYVMVLRGVTSLRGALEGVGPENQDFFGP